MIFILSAMKPSLMSAARIVIGVFVVAATVGLVVGLAVEIGIISGVLLNGHTFDLVLVIEAAAVLVFAALLAGTSGQSSTR